MKIAESWLRTFVDVPGDTAALVEQLTMQGLEVDSCDVLPALSGLVVAGRVISLEPHPAADRLRICQVDVGRPRPVQIVCGAGNVRVGGSYPAALAGAMLPSGSEIGVTKLRGVESQGMLCSARELGLGDGADGLLVLDEVSPGTPVNTVLALPDAVLDINITPNRADCLSVTGLARDVAAVAGTAAPVKQRTTQPSVSQRTQRVEVAAVTDCPVFACRVIGGIRPDAQSPLWLTEPLRRAGIRAIHPVVDVTNFVMLECGQPLHGYDQDLVQGTINVRRGRPGEALRTLTGEAVTVDSDFLVIADARGAIGLAGIVGGESTAISSKTVNVVLEAAHFTPAVIAGRARRLGLQTDASMRFERGVDPTLPSIALERATSLILSIAGGEPGPVQLTASEERQSSSEIPLRRTRLQRVLGCTVPDADVAAILQRLGMHVRVAADGWLVRIPPYRFDLSIEADLIEEVARVWGYARIDESIGFASMSLRSPDTVRQGVESLKNYLVDRGYFEAVTYSFTDPGLDRLIAGGLDGQRLVNPISADLATLRQSLWPGLLITLRHNVVRQQPRVWLFEVGVKFRIEGSDLIEEKVLAGVAFGASAPEQWGLPARDADVFDIKADIEGILSRHGAEPPTFAREHHAALHPGRSARIRRAGGAIGWVGELHPAIVAQLELARAPILFELSLEAATFRDSGRYSAISKYPAIRRDIAVLVDRTVSATEVLAVVRGVAGPVLRELVLFDVYTGERVPNDKKSLALGLILQETSRTLADADAEAIVGRVVERLHREFDAAIRQR